MKHHTESAVAGNSHLQDTAAWETAGQPHRAAWQENPKGSFQCINLSYRICHSIKRNNYLPTSMALGLRLYNIKM